MIDKLEEIIRLLYVTRKASKVLSFDGRDLFAVMVWGSCFTLIRDALLLLGKMTYQHQLSSTQWLFLSMDLLHMYPSNMLVFACLFPENWGGMCATVKLFLQSICAISHIFKGCVCKKKDLLKNCASVAVVGQEVSAWASDQAIIYLMAIGRGVCILDLKKSFIYLFICLFCIGNSF